MQYDDLELGEALGRILANLEEIRDVSEQNLILWLMVMQPEDILAICESYCTTAHQHVANGDLGRALVSLEIARTMANSLERARAEGFNAEQNARLSACINALDIENAELYLLINQPTFAKRLFQEVLQRAWPDYATNPPATCELAMVLKSLADMKFFNGDGERDVQAAFSEYKLLRQYLDAGQIPYLLNSNEVFERRADCQVLADGELTAAKDWYGKALQSLREHCLPQSGYNIVMKNWYARILLKSGCVHWILTDWDNARNDLNEAAGFETDAGVAGKLSDLILARLDAYKRRGQPAKREAYGYARRALVTMIRHHDL